MRLRSLLASSCLLLAAVASAPLARADGVLPAAATPVQREQAQARFSRAKRLMAQKEYDQALAEFRASHDIVASPNTRLEISRCLEKMGKLVAAYAELGRTSVEAKELVPQDDRYQRAYDAAMAERAEIQPQLGFVTIDVQHATGQTKLTVGGEEIERAAWTEPVPVAPPGTDVVVATPGRPPVTKSVAIAAGKKTTLTIDAAPPAPPPAVAAAPAPEAPPPEAPSGRQRRLRTWAYVAGGVGAAGLVGSAVFGLMAKSTYDDLNGACHGGPCPSSKSGEISSGKTQEALSNVGLAVGIVGLAAGGTLFYLSTRKSASETGAETAVVAWPSGIGLRGRW